MNRKNETGNSMDMIQDRIRYLRENTDFVSTLFESLIGYAIIAADFDGNIIAYNEGARQIYGYAPEEVIGKKIIEIFFPKEFIEAGKLEDIIKELIDKERYSYEGEKVRKDGRIFPAQILFTLTKDKNWKVVGFVEIVEDLTDRKRLQEAERLANAERIKQLEKDLAETARCYKHYLAISQAEEPADIETSPHASEDIMSELLPEYRNIVQSYVRAIQIHEDRPSDQVKTFARRLASMQARAKDVVRLHIKVLDEFSKKSLPSAIRTFSNDARLVLVELMGNLIEIYLNAARKDFKLGEDAGKEKQNEISV